MIDVSNLKKVKIRFFRDKAGQTNVSVSVGIVMVNFPVPKEVETMVLGPVLDEDLDVEQNMIAIKESDFEAMVAVMRQYCSRSSLLAVNGAALLPGPVEKPVHTHDGE